MKPYLLLALLLGGCAGTLKPPEPIIEAKPYAVATPVPCKVMTALGAEPSYPDTDAALAAAAGPNPAQPDIFAQVKLLLEGRVMRIKRLGQYAAAKAACTF